MATTVPSTAIPLTAEDRAILELESPTVVGHTAKVVHLGAPAPDAARLRARVARRLPSAPQLTWRLDGPAAAPVWRPAAVDLPAHIGEIVATQPLDTERLRVEVARLFHKRLDRSGWGQITGELRGHIWGSGPHFVIVSILVPAGRRSAGEEDSLAE